jgi:cephalosporin hydroxylase
LHAVAIVVFESICMMERSWERMNDRHQLDNCLELMFALIQYRHQSIHYRLRKMGRRVSMLHTDALQLIYHIARICHGCILEIGAFRGGSTVAAAWGVRDAGNPKKLVAIEKGGSLRQHPLATRNILRSLKRTLARERVAELVMLLEGHSGEPQIIAAVNQALGTDEIGLLILDADAEIKRDLDSYGKKLLDHCWLVIDDYGGPAENEKQLPTKTQVDELVNAGQLTPLGYYGLSTWVGQWRRLTPPPARSPNE